MDGNAIYTLIFMELHQTVLLMRTTISLFSLVGAFALHAAEPLQVPDFVRFLDKMENLEGVKAEAAKENKGVMFLLMEPGST
ncbi:MAG: hypothetical protein HKN23_08245 [Verrucomicrobiales bacterium]|nr:hypothetical protein [Verrucomicrobiales bacterium]